MLNRYVYWGVMLVSLSVLMLELILTRIFSVTMYYHFAFLAISLALFGSGASGIYIYLLPKVFRRERAEHHLAFAAMLCAVTVIAALAVLLNTDLNLTSFEGNYRKLIIVYLAAGSPFFFGGLCISLALTHFAETASKLYFYDLAGASIGCLLVIPALNLLGGPTAMIAISLPLFAGAFCFARAGARHFSIPAAVLFTVALALVLYDCTSHKFSITNAKGEIGKDIIFQQWNSFSRVTVTGNEQQDSYLQIKIDSDAATAVVRNDQGLQFSEPAHPSITALAYYLKKASAPNVLIIGPGGGPDVLNALNYNARHVTGAEINPLIADEIMRKFISTPMSPSQLMKGAAIFAARKISSMSFRPPWSIPGQLPARAHLRSRKIIFIPWKRSKIMSAISRLMACSP
jgi:hypothetical protein